MERDPFSNMDFDNFLDMDELECMGFDEPDSPSSRRPGDDSSQGNNNWMIEPLMEVMEDLDED